jgi:hypothetical protein
MWVRGVPPAAVRTRLYSLIGENRAPQTDAIHDPKQRPYDDAQQQFIIGR